MDEGKKDSGVWTDKIFDSANRFLHIETPSTETTIYRYPKFGDPSLWISLVESERLFKPWYYYRKGEGVETVTIPASHSRNVVHFFPPEAQNAIKNDTEENPWLDFEDEDLRGKSLSIMRSYIPAFVDLLTFIKNGGLPDAEYIVGKTNYRMANVALALGFQRCWEEGFAPIQLDSPLDDSFDHRVGVSVSELIDLYDLKNSVPTKQSVKQVLRRNIHARKIK